MSSIPSSNGLRHRLRYVAISLALLLLGLWLSGSALWQLGRTAVFVHEAVVVPGVVVDVRQKPFETWSDTLGRGNISMPGDVSYQPMVRFVLPGGISAFRGDLETDNEDYTCGQALSIISLPNNPSSARINRWKFLWGASCLRLGAGTLLSLIGYALLRRLKRRVRSTAPAPKTSAKHREQPAPQQKTRKRKAASSGSPRRRQKADRSEDGEQAPKKPRRSRRKQTGDSPELPL